MKLLAGTFLFSFASALNPFLPVEVYLAGVASQVEDLSYWVIALAAGLGAAVGKIVWYYAGTHSMRIPWLRKKMEKPKWKESYETWSARIADRPWLAGGITLLSGWSGFPPLAVISVLAGTLRMNLAVFVTAVLIGRTLRFWMVLAGVSAVLPH